jgi:hypothetical protein
MKKFIYGTTVLFAMAATQVFADTQWPPTPSNPVFKIDETNQHVSVFSTKDPASQSNDSVFSIYNKGTERVRVRPGGITEWTLNSNTGEAGKIMISTPGGGLGFHMWPGMAPDWSTTNSPRFDFATWPTDIPRGDGSFVHVSDVPTTYIGYNHGQSQTDFAISITQPKNHVGINTWTPTQRLEVKDGGIRINNASNTARPACNADNRGTLWVSRNSDNNSDNISICLQKNATTFKWRTIVSAKDDEHDTGIYRHTETD